MKSNSSLNTESKRKHTPPIIPAYAKGFHGLSMYLGGVSENTLRSWVEKGMPTIKIGDVILFKLADADAWLKKFSINGTSEEQEVSLDDILSEVGR